jgi:hypothetical protein
MKTYKHSRILLIVLTFTLLTVCTSCEKYADGPEIGWLAGSSLSYSYSGGALSGFTANLKFAVTDGTSGEIKLTAEHNDDKKSCVAHVEPGEEYTARVYCAVSSDGATGTIIVSSPSAPDPFTVKSEYKVIVKSISIN